MMAMVRQMTSAIKQARISVAIERTPVSFDGERPAFTLSGDAGLAFIYSHGGTVVNDLLIVVPLP
jgi:hypothetical protein